MDCADHDKSFIVGSTWSSAKKLKSSLIKECSRASANSENDSLRDKGRGKKYKGWSCCGKIDEERCTFSVSATQNGNIWTITKSNLIHTAHEVVNNPKKSRSIALQCLNSSFLRNYVCTDKIGGKESKAAKALVAQANMSGDNINKSQAQRFIQDNRQDTLEHELLSFTNIIPLILYLREQDPGGHYFLEVVPLPYALATDSGDTRRYAFDRLLCIPSATKNAWAHSRLTCSANGARRTSRLGGIILSIEGKYANNTILPFAFAICSAENQRNWFWFLASVLAFTEQPKVFIADNEKGLEMLKSLINKLATRRAEKHSEIATSVGEILDGLGLPDGTSIHDTLVALEEKGDVAGVECVKELYANFLQSSPSMVCSLCAVHCAKNAGANNKGKLTTAVTTYAKQATPELKNLFFTNVVRKLFKGVRSKKIIAGGRGVFMSGSEYVQEYYDDISYQGMLKKGLTNWSPFNDVTSNGAESYDDKCKELREQHITRCLMQWVELNIKDFHMLSGVARKWSGVEDPNDRRLVCQSVADKVNSDATSTVWKWDYKMNAHDSNTRLRFSAKLIDNPKSVEHSIVLNLDGEHVWDRVKCFCDQVRVTGHICEHAAQICSDLQNILMHFHDKYLKNTITKDLFLNDKSTTFDYESYGVSQQFEEEFVWWKCFTFDKPWFYHSIYHTSTLSKQLDFPAFFPDMASFSTSGGFELYPPEFHKGKDRNRMNGRVRRTRDISSYLVECTDGGAALGLLVGTELGNPSTPSSSSRGVRQAVDSPPVPPPLISTRTDSSTYDQGTVRAALKRKAHSSRTCRFCNKEGHTRGTCTDRKMDVVWQKYPKILKKVQLCRPITEELINSLRVPPNTNSVIQSLSQIVSDDVDMDESCFPDIDDEEDTSGEKIETAVEPDDMDNIASEHSLSERCCCFCNEVHKHGDNSKLRKCFSTHCTAYFHISCYSGVYLSASDDKYCDTCESTVRAQTALSTTTRSRGHEQLQAVTRITRSTHK